MNTKKIYLLFFTGLISLASIAQPAERRITRSEYIYTWKDEAVKHMIKYGIPASITLAQGILESGDGNSSLARYANNHFGIKCHKWDGKKFFKDDDAKDECFRKYPNADASYNDHALFLVGKQRYASLFELRSTDYRGWARGLQKAGYATNPSYSKLLVKIIEDNELYKHDKLSIAASKAPQITSQSAESKLNKTKHAIRLHDNNIKYIVAEKGDSFSKISREFDIRMKLIYKYNDFDKRYILKIGDLVYLQPKRSKAKKKTHRFSPGDSMHFISQKYGIKLDKLYKRNSMFWNDKPEIGDLIYLKGTKKT